YLANATLQNTIILAKTISTHKEGGKSPFDSRRTYLRSEYQEKVNKNKQPLFRQDYPYAGKTGFKITAFSNSTVTNYHLQSLG
ncbi:MAG: hypothetical protein KAS94_10185, partial [Desulfobulbaceae bacterium]|nr:hypothetical protein [Desulfobulbaceae bacterium]